MVNKVSGVSTPQSISKVHNTPLPENREDSVTQVKKSDKLELSSEALELSSKLRSGIAVDSEIEKLKKVKENISSGFYSSKEVIRTVARKISGDLEK
jgi:anti-sigma28 factor (negative regulator of flagellin synthesis)